MKMTVLAWSMIVLTLLSGELRAGELDELLARLRNESEASARAELKTQILKKKPKPEALIKALQALPFPKDVARGLTQLTIPGADKEVEAFVPEDYDPKKAWPVMIALHGMGGNGSQMRDRAVEVCRREGWILLCPTLIKSDLRSAMRRAGKTGFGWGDHRGNQALLCLRWLLRRYHLDTDRVYLMGVSLGAYGTWGIGTHHGHRFAALLPYAGGLDYRENTAAIAGLIPKGGIPKGFGGGLGAQSGSGRRRDLLLNLRTLPVYFVHGSQDTVVEPLGDRKSAEELKSIGYRNWKYVEKAGWKHIPPAKEVEELVDDLVSWAKKKVRDPQAPELVHFAPRSDAGDAGWVVLDDFSEGAKLSAKLKRNSLSIEAEDIQKLSVFFNADMVKLKRSIKLSINGKRRRSIKVKPSAAVVLDSYERWLDPARLYSARVTLQP